MNKQKLPSSLALIGGLCLVLSMNSQAQIKTIPKEGLPGLSKEAVEFEIEHNYRRENNLGQTVPAEEGTRPNSTNPQVLDGVWVMGKTYSVNADGSFSEAGGMPGMGAGGAGGMAAGGAAPAGAAPGAAPGGAPPGGAQAGGPPGGAAPGGAAAGGARSASCGISLSFTMGMPSRILETDKVMYIFSNKENGGVTNRRIEMNSSHPANWTPTVTGHSIGHWEGDTLIVETVGLKASGGGGGPGGGGVSVGANSKVTERIKKIEGGLKLENIVTVEDTVTKQASKQRVVSYYRPDLQYVEAPCEEYSDPFADVYSNPEASAKAISNITNAK